MVEKKTQKADKKPTTHKANDSTQNTMFVVP
jgi:hypothetical protein